jgi:hypothetical protein
MFNTFFRTNRNHKYQSWKFHISRQVTEQCYFGPDLHPTQNNVMKTDRFHQMGTLLTIDLSQLYISSWWSLTVPFLKERYFPNNWKVFVIPTAKQGGFQERNIWQECSKFWLLPASNKCLFVGPTPGTDSRSIETLLPSHSWRWVALTVVYFGLYSPSGWSCTPHIVVFAEWCWWYYNITCKFEKRATQFTFTMIDNQITCVVIWKSFVRRISISTDYVT